jgi:mRNA interferase MazF
VTRPRQGEIWWGATEHSRRPVLVLTRSEATAVLERVVVAPVTRTIRGIPTEMPLGPEDGLPDDCVASFDNVETVLRALLTDRVSESTPQRRSGICAALRALADC